MDIYRLIHRKANLWLFAIIYVLFLITQVRLFGRVSQNESTLIFQNVRTTGKVPDAEDVAKNPSPVLPKFDDQSGGVAGSVGGVVLFYHVAKTGGSTIRSLFKTIERNNPGEYKYMRSLNRLWQHESNSPRIRKAPTEYSSSCVPQGFLNGTMRSLDQAIEESILGTKTNAIDDNAHNKNNKKTLLLEIHGGPPGMDLLTSRIAKWRELSKAHGTPFFAFTLIREPTSYSISYFKFFYVDCLREKLPFCERADYNATEKGLLEATVPNRQCFLFKHLSSIAGMDPSFYDQCSVTEEDCRNTYAALKESMDWIGTTEGLSTETIPLLLHTLFADDSKIDEFMVKNEKVANRSPFEESLQESTLEKLHAMNTHDQWIYDQVKSRYLPH